LLLVFDATPVSLTVAQGGGIECAFDKPSRCAVVLPLLGAAHVQAETTEKWADGLPEDILARCQALASFARQYPLSARESFAYDESKDEAALTETVSLLELGSGGRKAAPLPPIAALAMKQGLPITVSAKLTELDLTTEFGPLVAAADTDTVTWTVRGLGKYVKQSRRVGNDAKPPATLEAELEAQVKKLLEAGPLAPWVFEDHFSKARGDYYWAEPGEVLYLLSEVHPVVGEQQQAALLRSMADLRAACPPPSVPVLAPDKGSRRGGYDTGPCPLSRQVLKERGKRVSLFALYGLARCCELTDTKPTQAEWEECKKVLAGAFQEQGWATLYLLGHPGRFVWPGYSVQPKEELETSRFWLGDRPGTVVNANRQFAGAVGAARLTRLAGDKAAEQQAWWMLARSAVLRVALGKYTAWRYDARLAVIPPKPDWAWQTRRNFSPGLLAGRRAPGDGTRSGPGKPRRLVRPRRWQQPLEPDLHGPTAGFPRHGSGVVAAAGRAPQARVRGAGRTDRVEPPHLVRVVRRSRSRARAQYEPPQRRLPGLPGQRTGPRRETRPVDPVD